MTTRRGTRLDLVAGVAALLGLAALAAYLAITAQQGDGPTAWVVVVLAGTAVMAAYGATRRPGHRAVLVVDGVLLGVVGLLAILTIGLLLVVAAALCLGSALRQSQGSAAAAGEGAPPLT